MLNSVWLLSIFGQVVVFYLASRKATTYPAFFCLVSFMAVKSPINFYVRTFHPSAYFYSYYRLDFFMSILFLAAVIEIFATSFRPYWTVPKSSLVTLTVTTVTALILTAKVNVTFGTFGEVAFYRSLDRVVASSCSIVLVAILLFHRHFSMPVRLHVKGISAGLFLMAVTSVISALLASCAYTQGIAAVFPVAMHTVTLSIWVIFLRKEETLRLVLGADDIAELSKLLNLLRISLSYTPTSCGLTLRNRRSNVESEEKAKRGF